MTLNHQTAVRIDVLPPVRFSTKKQGTVCVGAVFAKLLKAGRTILLPVGDNERYDLVIEEDGLFERVQCKAGRLKHGAVVFDVSSTNLKNGNWVRHHYHGQVEKFAVYCQELDRVYMIPIVDLPKIVGTLRTEPTKNKQVKKIRWAKDYEL